MNKSLHFYGGIFIMKLNIKLSIVLCVICLITLIFSTSIYAVEVNSTDDSLISSNSSYDESVDGLGNETSGRSNFNWK